ncbi:MAG: NADAR family protein [Reichenbachiella sp.]
MSQFINGDRLIYVYPNVSPPLPKESVIAGHSCRIWHKSQQNYCKRCASHGHRTDNVDQCESYDADAAVAAFRSDSNPLSNFYMCNITIGGQLFKSSEHAYQWKKCRNAKRPDLAERVLAAPTPAAAKRLVSELSPEHAASWDKIKTTVMNYVLRAKWNACGMFRQTLMKTLGMSIAEATQDTFWGVGVAPNLAQTTRPSKFLGTNHLGKCLESIRNHVNNVTTPDSSYDIIVLEMPPAPTPQGETMFPPTPPKVGAETNSPVLDQIAGTQHQEPNDLVLPPPPPPSAHQQVVNASPGNSPQLSANKGRGSADIHVECAKLITMIESVKEMDRTTLFNSPNGPTAPPRRKTSRSIKGADRKSSLERFRYISRDSSVSSEKRKASPGSDTVSPSSAHIAKAIRSDGGDAVS